MAACFVPAIVITRSLKAVIPVAVKIRRRERIRAERRDIGRLPITGIGRILAMFTMGNMQKRADVMLILILKSLVSGSSLWGAISQNRPGQGNVRRYGDFDVSRVTRYSVNSYLRILQAFHQ